MGLVLSLDIYSYAISGASNNIQSHWKKMYFQTFNIKCTKLQNNCYVLYNYKMGHACPPGFFLSLESSVIIPKRKEKKSKSVRARGGVRP